MSSSLEIPKAEIAEPDRTVAVNSHPARATAAKMSATRFRQIIVTCEVAVDLVAIALAVRCGYFVYIAAGIGKQFYLPTSLIWAGGAVFSIVMVLMLDRVGAYRRGNSLLRVRETEQILRVSVEALLAILAISFLGHILVPRWLLILYLGFVPFVLFVEKTFLYLFVHSLHSRGYGNERVLIYGAGCTGRRVFSVLRASPKLGFVPVAVVDDSPDKAGTTVFEMGYERRRCAPVLEGPVTRELLVEQGIDLVIIAIPTIGREKFVGTVEEALAANARVSFVPNHLLSSDSWLDYRDMDGILLASFGRPTARLGYLMLKRVFDLMASLALIALCAPLFLVIGLLIKLDSDGAVIFRQKRIGKDGKPFLMYKFRSMRRSASPYGYSPQESTDPRITRIGRFLRKTSLDELPQLFNVVQGSMSLVGPRPEMPFIVERYTPQHRRRLAVTPGITGLWQLSGDRSFLIHENIEYDMYYIRHRNFFMDLAIMLHTTIFAMRGI